MVQTYKATATQNPGRKSWLVEFRHPLRIDASNKPGKKTRRGLGTENPTEALRLVEQLNQLLADPSLWSVSSSNEAGKRYDDKIIEIFYGEIAPRVGMPLALRDKLLPLPSHLDGYARVALIGVPGAGKTTLLRQLIGTHPETERFPSTSVNRTTTFPTEIATNSGDHYEAVVTFMSEHEARFEIEESLSSAILEAINGGDSKKIARSLLEKSDMRFRLKYLLGDFTADDISEIDPYDDGVDEGNSPANEFGLDAEEIALNQKFLNDCISRIGVLAIRFKTEVESSQGQIEEMTSSDRNAALDLIEEQITASDEFLEFVSDILDELRSKFECVNSGRFEKTTTGWPNAWHYKSKSDERELFLTNIKLFTGIAHQTWGKLLTPLVNGLRVKGPFKPTWTDQAARLVLIDTEGLGHKADATADMPEQVLTLLHDADIALLVDSAKNGEKFTAGKALEAIVNTGNTRKLAVVFTHMDVVKGDNLKGQAKFDHVFGGLRNSIDNQLAKNVSLEAARYLLDHLNKNTFYVGRIDEVDPKPAIPELNKLLAHLAFAPPKLFEPVAFPVYSYDHLVLAIQEAARDFRRMWQGYLNINAHPHFKPVSWQSQKALARRYAEGWNGGFWLNPTSNLNASLASAISRFLETPIRWNGNPTEEQKRDTIDQIKVTISQQLPKLSTHRLRELPQQGWLQAYSYRGLGSTFDRRMRIEKIYERWVPIPDGRGDPIAQEFLNELKTIVTSSINTIERLVNGNDLQNKAAPTLVKIVKRRAESPNASS